MPGPTHLAIAHPGAVPAGTAFGDALNGREYGVPAGAQLVPGACAEIPWEELTCTMQKLDGSGPCTAPRLHDDDVCIGHKRAREKQRQKGS